MKLLALAVVTAVACGGGSPERLAREYIELEVDYPGATAAVVEIQVTDPLEAAAAGTAGVAHVISTSTAGHSSIRVEPARDHDLLVLAEALRERLTAILHELPVEASPPMLVQHSRATHDARLVLAAADRYDELRDEIQGIAGVDEVRACGVREPLTEVTPDLSRLAAARVTVGDLVTAIRSDPAVSFDTLPAVVVGQVRLSDIATVAATTTRACTALTEHGDAVVVTVSLSGDRAAVWERVLARARALGIEVSPLSAPRIVHGRAVIADDDDASRVRAASELILQLTRVAAVQWTDVEVDAETGGMRLAVGLARDASPSGVVDAVTTIGAPLQQLELWGAGLVTVDAIVAGGDLDAMIQTVSEATAELARDPALAAVHHVPQLQPELSLDIDRNRAAELGVESSEIGAAISAALRGIDVSSRMRMTPGDRRIVVRVPVDRDHLGDIVVRSQLGLVVPLSQLVTIKTGRAPREILHEDRQRVVIVRGLARDPAAVERALRKRLPGATVRAHLAPP